VIFHPQPLAGVHLIALEPHEDARGTFARSFCRESFAAAGLPFEVAQANLSQTRRRGTLRGLHWQAPPRAEAKLIRCVAGAVYDVLVDVRVGTSGFGCWQAVTLSAANRLSLYAPPGVAHGFQALDDDSELLYLMSEPYAPTLARGLRWDDPALAIPWPVADPQLSERDRSWPVLSELPVSEPSC
jgi:dTDP-4-dehydrorhamnose 3,5-epimerase